MIRTEQNAENFHIFFSSSDPRYNLRVTLRGFCSPFSLSQQVEEELNQLIDSVSRSVRGHFSGLCSQTDPLGWAVCYDPKVKETLVIHVPDAASVLDKYNGDYVKLEKEHRLSSCEGEDICLKKSAPELKTVADAMGRAYAKMAVENEFAEISSDLHRPLAPSLSFAEWMRPTAPSLSVADSRRSTRFSLDQASKNLSTIFNNASIALRDEFQNTFLGILQWRDLLHESRMYGKRRSVSTKDAEEAIETLVKNPQSKNKKARLFKNWLIAIARRVKDEAGPGFVNYLVSSLKGFYEESGPSQQAIIHEISASL